MALGPDWDRWRLRLLVLVGDFGRTRVFRDLAGWESLICESRET
jgi:hypothetical protein